MAPLTDLLAFNQVSWCKEKAMNAFTRLIPGASKSHHIESPLVCMKHHDAIAARAKVLETSCASVLVRVSVEEGVNSAGSFPPAPSHKTYIGRAWPGSSENVFSSLVSFSFLHIIIHIFLTHLPQ